MKIAIVSTYTNSTPPMCYGGESYYWGLADTLGKMHHEIHLFAKGGSKVPFKGFLHTIKGTEEGVINYAVEEWVEKKWHDLLMGCDIVHSCSLDHIEAERLRYLYGKREIINTINGHCYYMPRPPFNVVTGSNWWKNNAKENGLETRMVYWGIDTKFYCPNDNVRKENWLLWIARFHPDKGLDLALDLAEFLGFELKVAGSMQFKDHKVYGEKYIERIKKMPNVEYVCLPMNSKHHEAKRDLYWRAKAFLYPVQYHECFGMVVAEAMACGCPVITSDKGAMPELVIDGKSGWICPRKMDYVDAIQKKLPAYEDHYPCWYQGKKFSWQAAARGYEGLYEKVKYGDSW